MWETPLGTRALQGAEGDLFRIVAGVYQDILVDMAQAGEASIGFEDADNRWDGIPWEQQVIAIGAVAIDLLSPLRPSPPLFAWNELTIYQIYDFLITINDLESFGKPVLWAAKEAGIGNLKHRKMINKAEFKTLTTSLMNRILFPREVTPVEIRKVKRYGFGGIGLRDDYLSASFPAFTMERFTTAMVAISDERIEEAIACLPDHHLMRYRRGIEPQPVKE